MRRPAVFSLVALALLATAAAVIAAPRAVPDVPPAMPLELVPLRLDGWLAVEPGEASVLPADSDVPEHLARAYDKDGQRVWVSVGYYPNQAEGRRPPTRSLMFPGQGWSDLSEQTVRVPLPGVGGRLPATLVVMRSRDRRLAILYWYQLQGRAIASDHWYRAALLYNRLARGRADGALIRIATAMPETTGAAEALAVHEDFIRVFHPELLRRLPR
jgi:EpsI family protein